VIPLPKIGGFLPLIPILTALGALGWYMESIAMGKGLFLKPYKRGYGLFYKPYSTKKLLDMLPGVTMDKRMWNNKFR